jgi:hypothetical protein
MRSTAQHFHGVSGAQLVLFLWDISITELKCCRKVLQSIMEGTPKTMLSVWPEESMQERCMHDMQVFFHLVIKDGK